MNITLNNSTQHQNFSAYRITSNGLEVLNNLKNASRKNEFTALMNHFKRTKYANLFLDAEDCFCPETQKIEKTLVPYIEIPENLDLPLHKYVKDVRVSSFDKSNYNLKVLYKTEQNNSYSAVIDFPRSVVKNLKELLDAENCRHSRSTDNIRTFGDAIESKFISKEPQQPEQPLSERLNMAIDALYKEQNF